MPDQWQCGTCKGWFTGEKCLVHEHCHDGNRPVRPPYGTPGGLTDEEEALW